MITGQRAYQPNHSLNRSLIRAIRKLSIDKDSRAEGNLALERRGIELVRERIRHSRLRVLYSVLVVLGRGNG